MSGLRSAVLAHFHAGDSGPALSVESATYSYAVLGDFAAQAASQIRTRLGSGDGLRVAVLSTGTLTTYVAVLTAFELDATYIPLDPEAPTGRLRDALTRSRPDVMIIDQRHLELLELVGDVPVFEPLEASWHAPAQPATRPDSGPATHRYLLFTSGSTGIPKGIEIPDRCITAMFDAMGEIAPVVGDDVVAQTFDLTFDLAQYSTLACWIAGAHLAVLSPADRLDPVGFCQRTHVTHWFSVPSVARTAAEAGRLGPGALGSIRLSMFCGEALPAALAHHWELATGGTVWNLYGPTEATIACSAQLLDADGSAQSTGIVALGTPLRGTRLGLLTDGLARDIGAVSGPSTGELLIGGAQLFDGYLADPAKTEQALFSDSAGTKWYRSGDRVQVDENGTIGYLGRTDEQVQLRGYRVEPREVEFRIAEALGLRSDQVVVVPLIRPDGTVFDLLAGLDESALADPAPDDTWIGTRIQSALPGYMVPAAVRRFETFPLNANGKIDRAAIRASAVDATVGAHV